MRTKLTALFVAAVMLTVMIPGQVSAAGTGDGSSIDNARPVTSTTELNAALADPAVSFIETSGSFYMDNSVVIPSGKTVIVQPATGVDPALTIFRYTLKIDAGATLINNGGIGYTDNSSLELSGTLINNAKLTGMSLTINGGSLQNAAAALIDASSAIILNSGSISNSGTVSCMVYQTGAAGICSVTGVDASLIRSTNPIKSYKDMNFIPLSLEENVSRTIGLTGDLSEFITDPDDYHIFALGYAVSLTAGQSIVIQTNADFLNYMFICGPDKSCLEETGPGGMSYIATETGTYYLIFGGYDTLYTGSLSVTVFDPEAHLPAGLDFSSADSATGTGWAWDNSAKTLTLSGIVLSTGYKSAITLPGGSTIILAAGTKNIVNSGSDTIRCKGDLTITGSGSLYLDAGSYVAADGLSEVSVQSEAAMGAIVCTGSLAIHDAGVIRCSNTGRYALLALLNLSIENCADVAAVSYGAGIAAGGSISITGSSVTAYGDNFGICTGPLLTQVGESSLDSMGKDNLSDPEAELMKSISVPAGGDITITGSTVNASSATIGPACAIYAGDDIEDGTLGSAGVRQHAKIVLSGSMLSQPAGGFIADATLSNYKCQSITDIQGLTSISLWSQASKSVLIEPVYTLGYNPNGGTGSVANPGPATPSSKITIAPNGYTYTGLAFTGWNTAADGSGTSYAPGDVIKVTKNMVLYAMWKVNTYTVRFVDWNGTELSKATVNYGAAAKAPSNPSRSGYTFKSWDKAFSNVTSDLTVTAQYDAVQAAKVVKTGETGGYAALAWALLAAAAGVSTVYIAVRKKAEA